MVKLLSEKAITSFLMDNAKSMQKVLIQDIRDKFIERKGDQIVWKQGFRVRLQEIEEVEKRFKEAVEKFTEDMNVILQFIPDDTFNNYLEFFKKRFGSFE